MAEIRNYELPPLPSIDKTFEVPCTKYGEPTDYLVSLADIFQELSYNSSTKKLTISNGNEVDLSNIDLPNYYFAGYGVDYTSVNSLTVNKGLLVNDNGVNIELSSSLTKTTATWSVGNNDGAYGALDTGSIASNKFYYIYVIRDVNNSLTDVLYSLSSTTPTLPTGYTEFKLVGCFRTYSNATSIVPEYVFNLGTYLEYGNQGVLLPTDFVNNFRYSKQTTTANYIATYDIYTKDVTNSVNMIIKTLSSTFQKNIDLTFTQGHLGGALESALTANTNYYWYLIAKENGAEPDFFITDRVITSLLPSLPADFLYWQTIGYGLTDASSNLMLWRYDEGWEDENFDVANLAKNNSTITDAPGYEDLFSNGIKMATFDNTSNQLVSVGKEYPHKGKKGYSIGFHAHAYPENGNAGDVLFYVDYFYTSNGVTIPGTKTRITQAFPVPGVKGEEFDIYFNFVAGICPITGAELKPGTQIHFNFGRDNALPADTYNSKVAVRTFGFHYLADAKGSELLTSRV